jgi:hypothetical protein
VVCCVVFAVTSLLLTVTTRLAVRPDLPATSSPELCAGPFTTWRCATKQQHQAQLTSEFSSKRHDAKYLLVAKITSVYKNKTSTMPPPNPYNASLQSLVSLPQAQRNAAELRFVQLLETAFGSASKVRGAYCEWLAVRSLRAENPWDQCTTEEMNAMAHWEKVSSEATQLTLRELNIVDNDAFFELHVWNSRTH